jgi:hypothetical protein
MPLPSGTIPSVLLHNDSILPLIDILQLNDPMKMQAAALQVKYYYALSNLHNLVNVLQIAVFNPTHNLFFFFCILCLRSFRM